MNLLGSWRILFLEPILEIIKKKVWQNLAEMRHDKLFIIGACKKKTAELHSMNRNQLRTTVGFLTEYTNVKEHLYKIGVFNGYLKCRMCSKESETALHILYNCETLDRTR